MQPPPPALLPTAPGLAPVTSCHHQPCPCPTEGMGMGTPKPHAPAPPLPTAEAGGQQHPLYPAAPLLAASWITCKPHFGISAQPLLLGPQNSPLESQSILVYSSELRMGAEKSCRARRQVETPQAEAQSSFPSPGPSICVGLIILLQLPSPHSPRSPATFLAQPRSPSPAASSPGEKLGVICKCHAYFQKPARGS